MTVVVVTPPEPTIDLEMVKAHLRVEHSDDDALIETYISAACSHVDGPRGVLGKSIWAQTLELRQNVFCGPVRLPYGPVTEITSVKYVDANGVEQTLDPSGYLLTGGQLELPHGGSWPQLRGDAEGVRIRYQAGFAEAPRAIEQAILLLVGHWYANRETIVIGAAAGEMPFAAQALLAPYVAWSV